MLTIVKFQDVHKQRIKRIKFFDILYNYFVKDKKKKKMIDKYAKKNTNTKPS